MEDTAVYNDEDLKDHIGVAAVIKDSLERVLVQEHNKYGFWTIPIGKAAVGQSPVEALKEELWEECGIQINEYIEIAQRNYEYLRLGKKVKLHSIIYEIRTYSGSIKNKESHKHKNQLFKSIDEIKKLPYLSDATLLFLETVGYTRSAKL